MCDMMKRILGYFASVPVHSKLAMARVVSNTSSV